MRKREERSDLKNTNIERSGIDVHGIIESNKMDALGSRWARSLIGREFEKE